MTVAKWIVITALVVIAGLIAAVSVLGAMAGRDETTTVRNPGRMTQMEQSGQMHEMLQQHQDMLGRMRSDASPQMRKEMENDTMTQMMQTGEMIRMQEQHQNEIDRMMGRGTGR
jgi:hypothetical protein